METSNEIAQENIFNIDEFDAVDSDAVMVHRT